MAGKYEIDLRRNDKGRWETRMMNDGKEAASQQWPFRSAAQAATCMSVDAYMQMIHDAVHSGAEIHLTFEFREPGPVVIQ